MPETLLPGLDYTIRAKRTLSDDGWVEQNFRYLNGRRVRGYGNKPTRWVVKAKKA